VEVVETDRIEQDVVLHGGTAEAGIVGDARNAAIGALDDPVFIGVQFLRSAVWALNDVAIDQTARTEKRDHAGDYTLRQGSVAEPLEDDLTREVSVDAFVKRQTDIGESVQRDGAHHLKTRGAVHGQFERKSGEAFD